MKRKASRALVVATAAAVAKRQAAKKAKFLRELAKLPSIKHACQVAGIDRTTIYKWRSADAEFAAKWKEAIDASVDDVEAKAFRFALEDTDPATANARVRLWEFILKSHRGEIYRERVEAAVMAGIVYLPQKRETPHDDR